MSKRNKAKPAPQPVVEQPTPEQAPRKASIVPTVYKERYGKLGNNGDWFARWAATNLNDAAGKVNTAAVRTLAAENGYNDEALIERGNGWQGKHRMTVGNVIRAKIRKNGFFLYNGKEVRS